MIFPRHRLRTFHSAVIAGYVLWAAGPAATMGFAQAESVQPAAANAPSASTGSGAAVAPAMVPGLGPAAEGRVLSSAEGDYVLVAGDTIEMSIFREPDLSARSTIARDGSVQLPLLREVRLAGMSVRDARAMLTQLYAERYLVDPQIYLSVADYALRTFTIMGQVARPGSYELQGGQRLDLLQAIGMAGGFTRIADRGRILVRRTSGDDNGVFKLNAKRMAEGKQEMFEVLPGDIITIGETWF